MGGLTKAQQALPMRFIAQPLAVIHVSILIIHPAPAAPLVPGPLALVVGRAAVEAGPVSLRSNHVHLINRIMLHTKQTLTL